MERLSVAEIFESVQGEGVNVGRYGTFLRLQGCNLRCEWCDTDYARALDKVRGLSVVDVFKKIVALGNRYVVITGGEPLLQREGLSYLATSLKNDFRGVYLQVETNGTLRGESLLRYVDWITVSPKPPDYRLNVERCDEIKLVVDDNLSAEVVGEMLARSSVLVLQPEGNKKQFVDKAMSYARIYSKKRDVRLILQQHKVGGFR